MIIGFCAEKQSVCQNCLSLYGYECVARCIEDGFDMDVLTFRDYCLSLPFTEECTPFDETTLVYKVGGRMYAFADMVDFCRVALKCDPDEALQLRERYPREITPAYHANKRLWNDVRTTGDLPDAFIREQIRNSYLLVLRQNVTPRALRDELLAYVEVHGIPEK